MDNPVQYYNHKLEMLEHPQKSKIRKIVERNCLDRKHNDLWHCKPIIGYNTRTYDLTRTAVGSFRCNCQGYNKRGHCSHVAALNLVLGETQKQGCFL